MAATGYGVVAAGFYAKPLATISTEVDDGLKAILGDSAGTEADGTLPTQSMAGQLKALLVDGFAAHWDLMQSVYSSMDPNQNADASQDAIAAISGARRLGAQYTVATGVCSGDDGTTLDAGRIAIVEGTNARLASASTVQLATATGWPGASWYFNHGDTVYVGVSDGNDKNRVYVCVIAGLSDGSSPPVSTGIGITGTAEVWAHVGEGAAAATVPFVAESTGEVGALEQTMNDIGTAVDGWKGVVNPLDAEVGRARETNAAFRYRRDQELAAAGNTTVEAIRANILRMNADSTDPAHEPATECVVYFNDTDYTDGNGVPPHSIEVLVQDGTAADICQVIWDSVGAGTRTYGSSSGTVVDSEGETQTVYYTRPTEVPIYVTGTGRYDANEWPAGSDAIVAQAMLSALLTYTAGFRIGVDVRVGPLMAVMLRGPAQTDEDGLAVVPADAASAAVPGLLEVDPLYIGTSASPSTSTQISITGRQVATFASGDCVLTASAEVP